MVVLLSFFIIVNTIEIKKKIMIIKNKIEMCQEVLISLYGVDPIMDDHPHFY